MADWVHHNLNSGKVICRFRGARSNRVACEWVRVDNAIPKVSQKSRERNVRNRSRDVHARIEGDCREPMQTSPNTDGLRVLTYNPFHPSGVFRYQDTQEEWKGGDGHSVIVTGGYAFLLD